LEVGYSVLFTTLAHLTTDLATASHAAALKQRMRRNLAPQVLVIYEVGYTELNEEQANDQLQAQHVERHSVRRWEALGFQVTLASAS
jgi:DNA replication protein DnaC